MLVEIPVSIAELVDKVTILEIKLDNSKDQEKTNNIKKELDYLRDKLKIISIPPHFYETLKSINSKLWEIEDLIRQEEKLNRFENDFINYARHIYMYNDKRAAVKKEINIYAGSDIVEEKIFSQ